MDSRLLAGAYSKRYKYIERDHIDALKDANDAEKTDVLAKARKLSQETNRRRKLLAQKRKHEAVREEKRRQEILNRRHQEQQQATEKYQRYNVPARPPQHHHVTSRRHGYTATNTAGLDEALRMVRGSSAYSSPSSASQRIFNLQQTKQDPMERSYIKNTPLSRGESAGHGEGNHTHARPLSGTQRGGDSSVRAEMMERSLRNLTSSRSRFEQQLEQQQQLLVEQQQKSLHEFNEAIRREIETDANLEGTEDNVRENVSNHTDSLSSLDSLEEGNVSPLSGSLPEHQAQQEFSVAARQRDDVMFENGGRQQVSQVEIQEELVREKAYFGQTFGPQATQEQAIRTHQVMNTSVSRGGHGEPVTNARGTSHIIGPIPQGYNSPLPDAQLSSTPVVQGSYYPDSLDCQQASGERRVAVGTALRLPQQQPPAVCQPSIAKQPAPALQYNSQLLAHRKFESRPSHNVMSVPSYKAANAGLMEVDQQEKASPSNRSATSNEVTSAQLDYSLSERPKAHVYAWTSPPPEQEPVQNVSPVTATAHIDTYAGGDGTHIFAANLAADRVIATKVNPQSSRSMATSATTTLVYQTASSSPVQAREAIYSQAGMNAAETLQVGGSVRGMQEIDSFKFAVQPGPNTNHATPQPEIPKSQGQKPGPAMAKTSYTRAASAGSRGVVGPSPQSAEPPGYQTYKAAKAEPKTPQVNKDASIAKGTLGLMNGRLTVVDNAEPARKKVVIVENKSDQSKEVRGILKRVPSDAQSMQGVKGVHAKFSVNDSVEIAKKHRQQQEEAKRYKKRKKAVRFADLHYEDNEIEEDTDSGDSLIDARTGAGVKEDSQAVRKADQEAQQMASQRPRPASARVASVTAKTADSKAKAPRVASAGPVRNTPAARPKAAAHIIMSGENHIYGHNHNNHTSDAAAGITVHKSQLEKKVTLINNNFMSRIPAYNGITTAPSSNNAQVSNSPAATNTTSVYNVSQARLAAGGQSASAITSHAPSQQRNGFSKTSPAGGDNGRLVSSKTVVPTAQSGTVLPSHSHFGTANSAYKAVYNENGLRIDRTPTDDEINNLWMNMRNILEMGAEKAAPSASSAGVPMATNSNNSNFDSAAVSRQTVQLSNKYIDGAALGMHNGMTRVTQTSAYPRPATVGNGGQPPKPASQKNGYLQRYSLLQQRRNPSAGIGSTARTAGVVEQTVQPMSTQSNGHDPRYTSVNMSGYAPREEVTESMAGFMAAEQMVQTHGSGVSDSRVMAAMESAQQNQESYNSIRQKYAKGGLAALSMEERHLLESLDRLNDRLKAVETRAAPSQPSPYGPAPASHQVYVHRYL